MKQLLTLPGEAEQFEHYGEVYVTRQAYADLNEHSALVEMNLQAQIDLNEAYEARLLAENERLRGIVQADLEEKAEAWGEVERLKREKAAALGLVDGQAIVVRELERAVERLRAALGDLQDVAEGFCDEMQWYASRRKDLRSETADRDNPKEWAEVMQGEIDDMRADIIKSRAGTSPPDAHEFCTNCDSPMPEGCGGVFKDSDGDLCWLNRASGKSGPAQP